MERDRRAQYAFSIRGPIARSDLPGLCRSVCALLAEYRPTVALCDVHGIVPDAVTVDALARLQLAASRAGCTVRLVNVSAELGDLVAFMGLENVLAGAMSSGRSGRLRSVPETKEVAPMPGTARMLFANLAVKDLDRSVAFFTELGFSFDPRFTDETATAMVVNEQAVVMLLVESRFRDFTTKELVDPARQTEAIVAVSAESREDVDAFADKALAHGGSPANEPVDLGFMYGRSFNDPDGHLWEIVWMDMSVVESGALEAAAS